MLYIFIELFIFFLPWSRIIKKKITTLLIFKYDYKIIILLIIKYNS